MPSNLTIQILLCIVSVLILLRPGKSPFRRDTSVKSGILSLGIIAG